MQRFIFSLVIILFLFSVANSVMYADPILPLPRMPIAGDQDGSETPYLWNASGFELVNDVQNFRVPGSGNVEISFDFVFREAAYENEFGFFRVDSPSGEVNGLSTNDAGYLEAAFERSVVIFPSGSTAYTPDAVINVNGGDILVFFIVQNDTIDNLRANNPFNELQKTPLAFFSLDKLNPDGVDHFIGFRNQIDSITQFGFEDYTNGGDVDYDDIVYNIKSILQPSPPVEERSVIFIKGFTSVGDCTGANQWVIDYLNSKEGKSLFGRANINKYINFSYAGNDEGYSCPRTEPAYTAADTCDGVAHSAAELKALIDNDAMPGRVTIVAHSMGGLVAAYLVATQPTEWVQSHIASVITFESPLRGFGKHITIPADWFKECDFTPDPTTNESSLRDLEDTSEVVQRAAVAADIIPFYPLDATSIADFIDRNRTRLNNSRAFHLSQTCGGPFARPEPDCQPPLTVEDDHSQIWDRQLDGENRNKAFYVGCAVINALDCTVLQARLAPTVNTQRTLNLNQLQFVVDPGIIRMRFTSFYSGTVRMTLTAPNGESFGPDGAGVITGYAVDEVSEVYELTNLISGTWTIDLSAVNIPVEGIDVKVATTVIEQEGSTINSAPLADAGDTYTADIGETLTFNGIESFDADGSIVLYKWDFESDGTIDFSSTESYAFHTYPGAFMGSVTLRVTDNDGATSMSTSEVKVQRAIYLPLINR